MKEKKKNEKKRRLRDKLGKEHKTNRLRSILLLNMFIMLIAAISVYLAFYRLDPGTTQIQVIFVVQMFAGVSNMAIWIISIYMYGMSLDLKGYFQKNARLLDDALGEVTDLHDTLNSKNAKVMKRFINEVDWNEVREFYMSWIEEKEKDVDYDEELNRLLSE